MSPVMVMPASASMRARPKSVIQSLPASSSSRLAGLMSRCRMPF